MKKIVIASMLALAAVGCQNNAPKSTKPAANASVTDLTPTPATPTYSTPAPVYTPAPITPIASETPTAGSKSSAAASAGNYTVKKGDTLYGIAQKRYGDGKQWQKIASANPGLSAKTLKAGQTITLP